MSADNVALVRRLREESAEQRLGVADYYVEDPVDTDGWRLADLLEEAANRIEFLETQIENAKSALHLFKQPSISGTKPAGSWTTGQAPSYTQPKNGESK
jgi:hypothetical protein